MPYRMTHSVRHRAIEVHFFHIILLLFIFIFIIIKGFWGNRDYPLFRHHDRRTRFSTKVARGLGPLGTTIQWCNRDCRPERTRAAHPNLDYPIAAYSLRLIEGRGNGPWPPLTSSNWLWEVEDETRHKMPQGDL